MFHLFQKSTKVWLSMNLQIQEIGTVFPWWIRTFHPSLWWTLCSPFTDTRRDVILAGGLSHRFPWRHLPPPFTVHIFIIRYTVRNMNTKSNLGTLLINLYEVGPPNVQSPVWTNYIGDLPVHHLPQKSSKRAFIRVRSESLLFWVTWLWELLGGSLSTGECYGWHGKTDGHFFSNIL